MSFGDADLARDRLGGLRQRVEPILNQTGRTEATRSAGIERFATSTAAGQVRHRLPQRLGIAPPSLT
jgi:hypothetical protein